MGRNPSDNSACAPDTCEPVDAGERPANVGGFALDKYEVTVGRFRRFVEQYPFYPEPGAGAHPRNRETTGWLPEYDAYLPATRDELESELGQTPQRATWTTSPTEQENVAITHVGWPLAYAFCIWDGGRLPSEAEWEFVAAGGAEDRAFPWGSGEPTSDRANTRETHASHQMPVGALSAGDGRWGHAGLGGNVTEWTLDQWSDGSLHGGWSYYPPECEDCVELLSTPSARHVIRGGSFDFPSTAARSSFRFRGQTTPHAYGDDGIRCARDVD
jgi:sulfatase modifying factor 1